MGRRDGRGVASRRRATRAATYAAYLASAAWWHRRDDWFDHESATGPVVCRGCEQPWLPERDDLHHVTYARLGAEAHEDLWPMCRDCHEFLHWVLDRPGWGRAGRAQGHRRALAELRRRNTVGGVTR